MARLRAVAGAAEGAAGREFEFLRAEGVRLIVEVDLLAARGHHARGGAERGDAGRAGAEAEHVPHRGGGVGGPARLREEAERGAELVRRHGVEVDEAG